jgi:hypothetical protein
MVAMFVDCCVGYGQYSLYYSFSSHSTGREFLIRPEPLLVNLVSGQCFVFLFRQGTEQLHQGDVNTREAIPNTTNIESG